MGGARVTVVGGGLAGCEAAWQLAARGVGVRLVEMKPVRRTAAAVTDRLAELVCSNSFRSDEPVQAIGLMHEELRRAGSLVLRAADAARVPAGGALAVDRDAFAAYVEAEVKAHPLVEVATGVEAAALPEAPAIVATGPLTSDALAGALVAAVGAERLYFYDSIAPIVAGESVDLGKVFRASRYGKGDGEDYLNCPMTRPQYEAFVDALLAAERVAFAEFERARYFEGCLPIEVMAERGRETPRFGPMKPVGLRDPRGGPEPWAVVQLRAEDRAGVAYNLVGFQTKLKYGEQARVFRMIPGLEQAEFLRLGSVHRNTFLDAPRLLAPDLTLRAAPGVRIAGQLSGVEGYVESTAVGLLAALFTAAALSGRDPLEVDPPRDTALGAMLWHLRREAADFQPSNVNWGLFSPLSARLRKRERGEAYAARARGALETWLPRIGVPRAAA
ncbi:MAG TPA: methylenetetrahydrofolate--tRNA-(uracil(54)-C(5))-methyltransferase (FADH(2)-oxidizing) TrmFO [Myxococcota bacterium]|nr:methylenetetrahydrofolate--tRNA-(uracil(54)-C(5))-methyltransferase (FADH(2)-oxidizing) TrmFO [Myxococcota bacterium]